MVLAAKLVEGNHSGVTLANHLAEVLEYYSLKNSIFCITADNASNNNTMASHLATLIPFDNNNCRLGCMAHVINLAAQNSIKAFSNPINISPPQGLSSILNDPPAAIDISTAISRISGLQTFLKRSPQKAAAFQDITKVILGSKLNMIADVSTRWNSTFFMLQRALKLKECIKLFCEKNDLTAKYNLQPDEWEKIQQLCDFLQPLEEATNTISPSKQVTLSLAAPVYIWLIEDLVSVSFGRLLQCKGTYAESGCFTFLSDSFQI
jgi:hypothetical protein